MSEFEDFTEAIKHSYFTKVKQLFKKKYLNDTLGEFSPLHLSCMHDTDIEIVKFLLSQGFNIEEETVRGDRCIHLAAEKGRTDILNILINEGCELEAVNKDKKTALDIALLWKQNKSVDLINAAIAEKSVKDDLQLFEKYSLAKIMDTETKKTLLDKLLKNNDPKIIEAIKYKRVSDDEIDEWKNINLETIDPKSYKLLHECMLARCLYVKYDDGVYDLNTPELSNKVSLFRGPSTLVIAVENNASIYTIKNVLWNLVKEDETWARAEKIAQEMDQNRILSLISERRSILIKQEEKGFSRLHIAVLENDTDMIEYLVIHNIIHIDEGYKKGGTALTLAYYIGHTECAKCLLNIVKNGKILDKNKSTEN